MCDINTFFEKVYVISLKGSERRDFIIKTFNDLKIEFEFFDAVKGSELSENLIDEIYDKEAAANHKTSSRALTKSELGCALSHLNICKLMIKENFERVLIFEDDAKPIKNNLKEIQDILKELPDTWELLYLGVNANFKMPFSYRMKLFFYYPLVKLFFPKLLRWRYSELWRLYPKNYSLHLNISGYHQGAHAYGLSLNGAQKLLNKNEKITATYDALLGQAIVEQTIKGYLVKKNMFIQNKEFDSQIESTWAERQKVKEKNILKRIKDKYMKTS